MECVRTIDRNTGFGGAARSFEADAAGDDYRVFEFVEGEGVAGVDTVDAVGIANQAPDFTFQSSDDNLGWRRFISAAKAANPLQLDRSAEALRHQKSRG
jgi:hypothetical protein